jgi:hypothetical protein
VYRRPRDRGAVKAGLSRRDAEDLCVAKIEELRGAVATEPPSPIERDAAQLRRPRQLTLK